MDKEYNTSFVLDIMYLLSHNFEDLEQWSVHNEDTCLDEILELKDKYKQLRAKIYEKTAKDVIKKA